MIDMLKQLVKNFYPFAKNRLKFNKPVDLFFKPDFRNAQNPLGKTAYYDPESLSITIYTANRHPKDILRSFSHELVHHAQNCRGEFNEDRMSGEIGEGYAQKNEHLREMEREAYERGNLCFRDWEDAVKSKHIIIKVMTEACHMADKELIKEQGEKLMSDNGKSDLEFIKGAVEEVLNETTLVGDPTGTFRLGGMDKDVKLTRLGSAGPGGLPPNPSAPGVRTKPKYGMEALLAAEEEDYQRQHQGAAPVMRTTPAQAEVEALFAMDPEEEEAVSASIPSTGQRSIAPGEHDWKEHVKNQAAQLAAQDARDKLAGVGADLAKVGGTVGDMASDVRGKASQAGDWFMNLLGGGLEAPTGTLTRARGMEPSDFKPDWWGGSDASTDEPDVDQPARALGMQPAPHIPSWDSQKDPGAPTDEPDVGPPAIGQMFPISDVGPAALEASGDPKSWVGLSSRDVKQRLADEHGIAYRKGWWRELPKDHPARVKFRSYYNAKRSGRGGRGSSIKSGDPKMMWGHKFPEHTSTSDIRKAIADLADVKPSERLAAWGGLKDYVEDQYGSDVWQAAQLKESVMSKKDQEQQTLNEERKGWESEGPPDWPFFEEFPVEAEADAVGVD